MASDRKKSNAARAIAVPGYTVELRLDNQLAVIIGAGRTGLRKLPDLFAAGAKVCLIDPALRTDIPQHPQLTQRRRSYRSSDLSSARLVFAATDDSQLNATIANQSAALGILCCRVDSAKDSDFISPARLLRPPLSFSVSTGGASPAMASALRELLAEMIPPSWQTAASLAAAIRRKVLTGQQQIPYNQQVLLQLIDQGLLKYLEQSDQIGIDRLLLTQFGAGFSLNDLQFSLPEGTP